MNTNVKFANLTEEQISVIQKFEDEFNAKYHNTFFIMAYNKNQ